jgi:hypothetical protein
MINQLMNKRSREESDDSRPSKRPRPSASAQSTSISVPSFADSGLQLTSIRDDTDLLSNQDTVTLSGILSIERDLVSMFQFNYLVDLEFFHSQLSTPNCKTTFVVHGISID